MTTPKYLTIAYEIFDTNAFKEQSEQIFQKLGAYNKNLATNQICAASHDNEFKRIELIEETLRENSSLEAIEDIRRIMNHPNIMHCATLDDIWD